MKKDSGSFKNMLSFLPIVMVAMLTMITLQLQVHQAASTYIEDALVASNLASAVVDVEEYGISRLLVIEEPRNACGAFQRALQANLSLNAQWICDNSSLIDGKVTLNEYSLYEVRGNDVIQYYFPEGKQMYKKEFPSGAGLVQAPDGTKINSTSVYSKISFPVSFFGIKMNVYKQKCVDVVEN